MKIRTMVLAAAALGLGLAAWMTPQACAQPMWDVVKVTLPYTVTIGHRTLNPGDYTIQQLHSEGSNVLLIYNDNGMKFQTSAMTIKALDPNTPQDTSVILHHVGDDYYFDKIWIVGKDYGYEFPLPASVKSREKEMSAVTVPAQASTTANTQNADTTADANTDTTTSTADTTATASDTTPATPATPTTTPTPAVTTPATPEPQPQASTDTQQTPVTPQPGSDNSANREKRPASDDTNNAPAMPSTSAGWLAMLLSGGTLSGVGMMLRRKR